MLFALFIAFTFVQWYKSNNSLAWIKAVSDFFFYNLYFWTPYTQSKIIPVLLENVHKVSIQIIFY